MLGSTAFGLGACSEAPAEPSFGESRQSVLMQGNVYGDGLAPKTVVLTYDDGPDEHTLALATYLNQQGVKATFFVNGNRFCKTWQGEFCVQPVESRPCNDGQAQAPVVAPIYYPESILDELVALGHRIGNHTTDHCHLDGQDDPEDFAFELKTTQDIVDRHICDGLYLFRAPFGVWDGQAAALARGVPELDKLTGPINWDVDGGDWECFQKGTSIEACGEGYLNILQGRPSQRGIFLLHDRPEFNVGIDGPLKLTQYLVPRLKERGYAFSTLDELLDFQPQGPMACRPPTGGTGGTGGVGGAAGTSGASGSAGNAGLGGAGGSSLAGGAGNFASAAGAAGVAGAAGAATTSGGGGDGSPAGAGGLPSAGASPAPTSGGTGSLAAPASESSASCRAAGAPASGTSAPASGTSAAVMLAALALLRRGRPRRSRASAVLKSLGGPTHFSFGRGETPSAQSRLR